ncbi:hypothetical protein CSUB01_08895 [Colletotrichum sublineola]|uniref:Uncharacterized protein n=1 Tax=Colletotrichum sublineola TaxID=1173701 RepID=A0A066WZC8_COLSU|nr:hypothetical protein CSUB01_08895 [Colletotrichum sublineola]
MAGQKPPSFQDPQFAHSHQPPPSYPQAYPHPQFQQQHHGTPPGRQPPKQPPRLPDQYIHHYKLMCEWNAMNANTHKQNLSDFKQLLEQFVIVNRQNAEQAGVDAANAILQDQKVMRSLGPQIDTCDTEDESRKEETKALKEILRNICCDSLMYPQ